MRKENPLRDLSNEAKEDPARVGSRPPTVPWGSQTYCPSGTYLAELLASTEADTKAIHTKEFLFILLASTEAAKKFRL